MTSLTEALRIHTRIAVVEADIRTLRTLCHEYGNDFKIVSPLEHAITALSQCVRDLERILEIRIADVEQR